MKAVSGLWKKPPPANSFAPWSSNMTPAEDIPDSIYLRNLQLSAVVGSDAWRRPDKKQLVIISLRCGYNVSAAGSSDKVVDTVNYGSICKVITSTVEAKSWSSVGRLVIDFPTFDFGWPILSSGEVTVQLPKAILRAEGGLEVRGIIKSDENGDGEDYQLVHDVVYWEWTVKRIRVACIIGVNPHERLQKQDVLIDIKADDNDFLYYAYKVERMSDMERWRQLVERTIEVVETSSYETIEALATAIAYAITNEFIFQKITVRVEKPNLREPVIKVTLQNVKVVDEDKKEEKEEEDDDDDNNDGDEDDNKGEYNGDGTKEKYKDSKLDKNKENENGGEDEA